MRPAATDRDGIEDELALWLHVLKVADTLFDQLPPSTQREINAGASRRELTKMAGPLATLSTETRARIESIILNLGGEISPPEASGSVLHLVDPEGG